MTTDEMMKALQLKNKIKAYEKFRDDIVDMTSYPGIPVEINPDRTPLTIEDTDAIQRFIFEVCNRTIAQLQKEFKEL